MKACQAGLSYIEVLVATTLIAIALVPMMESLQPGLQGSQVHREKSEIHFALRGRMEALLVESFADLDAAATAAGAHDTPTTYSDLGANQPYRVYLSRYDVDNLDNDGNVFTGGEADMLWLKVESEDGGFVLETLLSPY